MLGAHYAMHKVSKSMGCGTMLVGIALFGLAGLGAVQLVENATTAPAPVVFSLEEKERRRELCRLATGLRNVISETSHKDLLMLGLQEGHRRGRCYVDSTGVTVQRTWDDYGH